MIFKKYPFIITKDNSNGNHYAICPDLDFACTIHNMTLVDACGAAMSAINQLCNSLAEQGLPLPEATPLEIAKRTAPENALIVSTVIIARKEDCDPSY